MSDMSEFTTGPLTLHEMIKIVSLLENPPEADHVRKALRFYEVPEAIKKGPATWGTTEELRKVLWHFALPQNQYELEWMLERVKGSKSLLEIGSSFGGTLERMAAVMEKGSTLVSVDLACDDTPKFLNPVASLKDACKRLSIMGANVQLFIGDSHKDSVIEAVSNYSPFDFCFIDGDHTYEGVKADWLNYGPMASVVAFHDIAGLPDVRRFWEELKTEEQYRTEEMICAPGESFGIGIVYREG